MLISIHAPINSLSYGLVSTNIIHSLTREGNKLQIFPINEQSVECEPQYQDSVRQGINNAQFFKQQTPCVKIWHQWQYSTFPANNLRCGFPIFELDHLTPLERHNLNSLDLLFVCSDWAKEVCLKNDITTPIRVVPLGVDGEIFKESNFKQNKTVFLNIGKWEYRKGHVELLEVFNSAFNEIDKVELWMASDNVFLSPEDRKKWHDLYKSSKLSSKIKLLGRLSSQFDLKYIMEQATFGVFPSRAEGWGLGTLEMMSVGKPSIVTNYAGHTQFCSDQNSLLVNFEEFEQANDGIWFRPGTTVNQGKWGKFTQNTKDALVEQLRYAHQLNMNKDEKLKGLKEQCIQTAKKFSWENTANLITKHLSTFV